MQPDDFEYDDDEDEEEEGETLAEWMMMWEDAKADGQTTISREEAVRRFMQQSRRDQ